MGYQPSDSSDDPGSQLISDKEQLLLLFTSSYKKPDEVVIGMEVEKHGIHRDTHAPVTYLEQNGVRAIQEKFVSELDWKIDRQEGKFITSMSRCVTHFSLDTVESLSELSGRTHPSIHDLARELRIHQNELTEMSRIFGIVWLGIGYQPFAKTEDLRIMRIRRYDILDNYFKKRSRIGLEYLKKVASIQANIDYTSEDDARKKFQVLLKLAPFLSAMYAHSPLREGKSTGYVSYRTYLLRHADPRRFGCRKKFFEKNFGFKEWIDFCISVPMMALVRNGNWVPVKKITFEQYLKSGYEGMMPTLNDFIMHMSYIYTDARIRKYIELRVCDSLPPNLIPSLQALVKAFVYHKDGEAAINDITKNWKFSDFARSYHSIALHGLAAIVREKKVLDYCKEILNIATTHLRSLHILNEKGEDESVHLQPIKEFVFVHEKSPGKWLVDNWEGEWHRNPQRLIEWCSFEQNGAFS